MQVRFFEVHYVEVIFCLFFATVTCLFAVFVKNQARSDSPIEFVIRNQHKISMITRGVEFAAALFLIAYVFTRILDAPNLICENYKYTSGEVVELKNNYDSNHVVRLEDDKTWYNIDYEGTKIGDRLKIAYLPISKCAIVIEYDDEKLY